MAKTQNKIRSVSTENTIQNQIDSLQQQLNMRKSITFGEQSQLNNSGYDMFFGSSRFNAQRSELHNSFNSTISDKENQILTFSIAIY